MWRCQGLSRLVFVALCFLTAHNRVAAEETISFDLLVSGLQGPAFDAVRDTFDAAALMRAPRTEALVSVANLRAQVRSDAELMIKILRAHGYYDNNVSTRFARRGNHFNIDMVVVPGPLYSFGDIEFEFQKPVPDAEIREKLRAGLEIQSGAGANAEAFVAAEAYLDIALPGLGFPFAKRVTHDLVVDHQSRQMNVTFFVDAGNRTRMGTVVFNGLKSVKQTYLQKFLTWQEGVFFEQRLVEGLRTQLLKSGLFTYVEIEIEQAEERRADINVTVIEAEQRTIGATAGYSTAEGFGGEVSWEHRNMFGRGGVLKFTGRGAEIEQSVAGRLELPNFARLDQTLSFESSFRRQNTDAFLSCEGEVRAGIDRVVTSKLAVFAGTVFEYSDVTDAEGDRDFLLASLPFGARWDSSDDLLNPSQGLRASLVTAPSANLGSNGFTFLRSEFRASSYFPVLSDDRMIVALRTRLGSIFGASNETLPATQRFFAGGGGSIRGFSFQAVGPLGPDNQPFGGRSVAEIAGEVRLKVSDSIGLVPFIEGGNTYVKHLPKFSDFRWGAGVGARYYTDFGPVRLDVAFPLDRRAGESGIQIYVSLGQAF